MKSNSTLPIVLAFSCALLVSVPVALSAQNPVQPTFAVCSSRPMSAIQVQTPVRFIGDSMRSPRPDSGAGANVVQFVVDTSGVPDARTFELRRVADSVLVAGVRRDLVLWRFTPAIASGCKVPQIVVTAVRW